MINFRVRVFVVALLMTCGCAAGRVAARRSPLSWAHRSPNSHMKVFFMPTAVMLAEIVYWLLVWPYYSVRQAFGKLPVESRKAWFEEEA